MKMMKCLLIDENQVTLQRTRLRNIRASSSFGEGVYRENQTNKCLLASVIEQSNLGNCKNHERYFSSPRGCLARLALLSSVS